MKLGGMKKFFLNLSVNGIIFFLCLYKTKPIQNEKKNFVLISKKITFIK